MDNSIKTFSPEVVEVRDEHSGELIANNAEMRPDPNGAWVSAGCAQELVRERNEALAAVKKLRDLLSEASGYVGSDEYPAWLPNAIADAMCRY